MMAIEEEIKERKKKKIPIPKPNIKQKYSGKLLLRIDPDLHEYLSLKAKAKGQSINSYVKEKILI